MAASATGATMEEVAARFGVKRQTLYRVLQEAGVKPGGRVDAREAGPAAPSPTAPPEAAAPVPPAQERRRPPQEVLESIAADERAPASQRVAASKTLIQYTHGKAVAGQAVGFGGQAVEEAPPFDPTRLDAETRRRYLDALKTIDDIEAQALRAEADGTG